MERAWCWNARRAILDAGSAKIGSFAANYTDDDHDDHADDNDDDDDDVAADADADDADDDDHEG
eukprot:6471749-Amphidinium_carterae.2